MNALSMLFGAALVALGVLAAALADRVRGLHISRDAREALRERGGRAASVPPPLPRAIPVTEVPEFRAAPARPSRAPRESPKVAGSDGGDDVIAALVAAGYKKPIAAEATWACGAGERASIEGWTAAALRRCARGGMS
jgi:hypothetical protein